MSKLKVSCSSCGAGISRRQTKTGNYFCNTDCKGLWQKAQREKLGYTKEWLIDQYHNKGKTCNEIAKEIGRNPKGVWQWMKDYGIEINPRGSYYENNLTLDGSAWKGRKHKKETKDKIRQARFNDGHVPYLKDGEHWLKHESSVHPNWKGGISPERQKVYSSKEWSEVISKVWNRDKATCQNCKSIHNGKDNKSHFHIHHIIPFENKNTRTQLENLVLLCRKCHLWVHSKKNTNLKFIKND